MNDPSITLTQGGQTRAYGDTIHAGSVTAQSEEEARAKLQAMCGLHKPIYDKQDKDDWAFPYFKKFAKAGDSEWAFVIVQEYTG